LDLTEITRTVLSWVGIELIETDPELTPPFDPDRHPQPPHHIGPDGRPRIYKNE
jgi:hypothetical protein